MHSKNGDIKCISRNDANEAVSELFKSFLSRFEGNLETSITESDSIFDSDQVMYHKCRKVYFRSGGSYIDSAHWIKKKKAAINPDDKCFQCVVTVVLNYKENKWNPRKCWKY